MKQKLRSARFVALLLTLCLVLGCLPARIMADETSGEATPEETTTETTESEEAATSGACGDNLTWEYADGTLTIRGTGAMENYQASNSAPWNSFAAEITSIVMETGVTSIGSYAFVSCGVTSINIPNSVTSIGDLAFCDCINLTAISIPESVTSLGNTVFSGCTSLATVEIPNSVTSIGDGVFYYCVRLTAINIPESVTSIGIGAFACCTSLTEVSIPGSVTSLGDEAFWNCTSLTAIYIPASVTSIGADAFLDCANLTIYGVADSYAQTYAEANEIPFAVIYQVIEGDNSQWSGDSEESEPLSFHVDGEMDKFEDVYMDGVLVDPDNYTVTEGSTIITFKDSYLKTLAPGNHTVTINFNDGSVEAEFTVVNTSSGSEEPTKPAEDTTPSDTTEPTETTEPSETTEPTETTEPSETTEPTESTTEQPAATDNPKTGDGTLTPYFTALLISLMGIMAVVIYGRKFRV